MEQSNDPGTLIVPPSASLSQAVLEGLQAVAAKPCDESKAHRRELTKRQTTTGWHVRLQCVRCGIGTGPAFKQREHPNWRNYPEYDVDRFPRWHAERRAATKAI